MAIDEVRKPRKPFLSLAVDLVGSLTSDARHLVQQEVNLAKAEASRKAEVAKTQLTKIIIGAGVAITGLVLILTALAFGASALFRMAGLSEIPAYLAGFGLLGIIFAIVGVVILKQSGSKLANEGLKPKKTTEQLQETKTWAKTELS